MQASQFGDRQRNSGIGQVTVFRIVLAGISKPVPELRRVPLMCGFFVLEYFVDAFGGGGAGAFFEFAEGLHFGLRFL